MARIRPASSWQHPRAPIRLIANTGRVALRRVLRQAFGHLRTLVDRKEVARLISHGRMREIHGTIDWHHAREMMKGAFDKWAQIYETGAMLGARKINGSFSQARRRVHFRKEVVADLGEWEGALVGGGVTKAVGDRFNFDRFDPATQQALRDAQDELIVQLENDARDTIETVIMRGQFLGLGPDELAAEIQDAIALTDTQAVAVMNYRAMLENLDPGALTRRLSDTDIDAIVADAIASETPLADAFIDDAVDKYRENYLQYRADTISQTESVRAANMGLHDAYSQAIERGALPAEAVTRRWQVSLDEKTCPVCLSVLDQNPDGVGVDEDFDSIEGPQDDPPVHPNCRCSVEYVTDLDLVPQEDEEAA